MTIALSEDGNVLVVGDDWDLIFVYQYENEGWVAPRYRETRNDVLPISIAEHFSFDSTLVGRVVTSRDGAVFASTPGCNFVFFSVWVDSSKAPWKDIYQYSDHYKLDFPFSWMPLGPAVDLAPNECTSSCGFVMGLALSRNGTTLAVGGEPLQRAPVRVYRLVEGQVNSTMYDNYWATYSHHWTKMGEDIWPHVTFDSNGTMIESLLGSKLALSGDGLTLASTVYQPVCRVDVFGWSINGSASWSSKGSIFVAEQLERWAFAEYHCPWRDTDSTELTLSNNGLHLAIPHLKPPVSLLVFEYDGDSWQLMRNISGFNSSASSMSWTFDDIESVAIGSEDFRFNSSAWDVGEATVYSVE